MAGCLERKSKWEDTARTLGVQTSTIASQLICKDDDTAGQRTRTMTAPEELRELGNIVAMLMEQSLAERGYAVFVANTKKHKRLPDETDSVSLGRPQVVHQ